MASFKVNDFETTFRVCHTRTVPEWTQCEFIHLTASVLFFLGHTNNTVASLMLSE
jgi:hypothetical protein